MTEFISNMFGGGKKQSPPQQQAPPTRAAASGAGKTQRKRRGTKTILTNAQGLDDEELTTSKTILGG